MNKLMSSGGSAPAVLDPFSFHGHTASVIKGIGGATPNADPTYAFHTEYVRLARGRANFAIHLPDLEAKQGTLVLRVHLLPDEPGSVASMVTSERIQLNRLAQNGGHVQVTFEAFRSARYALMGLVAGQTDASASDLRVTVERLYDETAIDLEDRGDGAPTRFGNFTGFKKAAHIIAVEAPTLGAPTSQIATRAQLDEPIFEQQRRALGLGGADELAAWSAVYQWQALAVFEMAQAGARGLLVGSNSDHLAALLAAQGCALTVRSGGASPSEGADLQQALHQGDLLDFDFVCSAWLEPGLDPDAVQRMIESSFGCLRPSGLAVHVVGTGAYGPGFSRAALERLSLNMLSKGHDVARLRLAPHRPEFDCEPGAAGFIARRTSRWL
ncbi:hypothetical protein ACNFJ7_12035 [Sphingomonas sp. HT-1]|uniref:hypothetical protein n=1 Tax=unclassified Sphingomonas TaxID=196159 RepID=UPI0003762024|nr:MULTISPECIES: hypothetical protein [unclassified Sphingomonas]KTF68907.1 hypothetical protein ATB93_11615 [Sphingomonas sp. WG]